jgi:hypothetical protein
MVVVLYVRVAGKEKTLSNLACGWLAGWHGGGSERIGLTARWSIYIIASSVGDANSM